MSKRGHESIDLGAYYGSKRAAGQTMSFTGKYKPVRKPSLQQHSMNDNNAPSCWYDGGAPSVFPEKNDFQIRGSTAMQTGELASQSQPQPGAGGSSSADSSLWHFGTGPSTAADVTTGSAANSGVQQAAPFDFRKRSTSDATNPSFWYVHSYRMTPLANYH
jgi:hypothetical protein